MALTIVLMIVHILCMIAYAYIASTTTFARTKIIYIIGCALWGLCIILDIIRLIIII